MAAVRRARYLQGCTLLSPAMQERPASAPTILVADDDAEQRSLYAEILTAAGYRVLQAGDGEGAVTLARGEHPDLMLMDVTMPVVSGWNAVRVLREDPSTLAIPIIVVTGLVDTWDRDASIAAAADSHLTKPVRPERLLSEVHRTLHPRYSVTSPSLASFTLH